MVNNIVNVMDQDIFLVFEIIMEQPVIDAGGLGDVLDGRLVKGLGLQALV
jgi:hypothetical protein